MDPKYILPQYSKELFYEEFQEFHHLFDKETFQRLADKRDRLDAIRKILQSYLNFYSDQKFDFMGIIFSHF